jgi:hypothetical protein
MYTRICTCPATTAFSNMDVTFQERDNPFVRHQQVRALRLIQPVFTGKLLCRCGCNGCFPEHARLVVNNRSSLATTPVIKAVVRDLKTYMRLRNEVVGQRVLPVGYDAAGTAEDKIVFEYLAACNTNSAIDFWAVSAVCRWAFVGWRTVH